MEFWPVVFTTRGVLQGSYWVLVAVAACLLGNAAAAPAEATFNFTYGYNPSAISLTTVNYTDSNGTALKVSRALIVSHAQGAPCVYFNLH